MSFPSTPPNRSGVSTPTLDDASGYLLLTIEHAVVKQIYDEETMTLARGEFRLECVSLPIPKEIGHQTANPFSPSPADPPVPTHDFWLVIKVGPTFEMPILPNQPMIPSRDKDGLVYTVPSPSIPNGSISFVMHLPNSQADLEDLDSLEVLLKQYGCLDKSLTALNGINPPIQAVGNSEMLAPEELRGRIVLINEDNGQVVGELEQTFDVEEDKKLANEDKNKPVMLDFGHVREGSDILKVKVKTVPEEDLNDWLLRGAHKVSQGILSFGSWSSRQMISGANVYIRNSTPRPEPMKISPQTKQNIVKVHNGSIKAATVTKTTIGKITGVISTAAGKTYTHGYKPAVEAYRRSSTSSHSAPPLPPRSATTATGNGNIPVPYAARTPTSVPPIPAKPSHLHDHATSPIPLQRTPSPTKPGGAAVGYQIPLPNQTETMLAEEQRFNAPPSYSEKYSSEPNDYSPGPSRPRTPDSTSIPQTQPKKKALLGRILLAGEVVLTSLEATAHDLINNGTIAASNAAGHKYGPEAGEATALVGGSVKNVAVVYIDVAGVGRRAVLKSTAKGFVKAKLADGETVKLQAEGHGDGQGQGLKGGEVEIEDRDPQVGGGEKEIVVGMPEIQPKKESGFRR
ncbi:hypothetical protein I204_04931 [Kwoniella mangroviensis CBS 8886]|uniref:uncharacterized protein n=1 Tax=Kwoniella mangroviensis CBS 8507 TaxID=1296122 RepID=UPI00080D2763|nr:uncharacterized protein I203_06345 [Kwoniella mangroviensis CBS 8507]OCF64611.1 hypothetical protein I203_06345 [Kwoniella mangroviensis CBS 8507]OCF74553.1 hypothetical protein I204_04931 [Kwoniella mangroviensis CBS 8886]